MKKSLWFAGIVAPTAMVAALGTGGDALAETAEEDYCREYQREVTIGGKVEKAYGTACMQPDGSWKMVREEDAAADRVNVVTRVVEQPVIIKRVVLKRPVKKWRGHHHHRHHPAKRVRFNRPASAQWRVTWR